MGFNLGNMLGGALNRTLNSAGNALGQGIGNAVGNAVGNAAGKVVEQAGEGIATDMQVANEAKMMVMDTQKKISNLPPHCPHCGAPTSGVLVCEYCNCKIVQ